MQGSDDSFARERSTSTAAANTYSEVEQVEQILDVFGDDGSVTSACTVLDQSATVEPLMFFGSNEKEKEEISEQAETEVSRRFSYFFRFCRNFFSPFFSTRHSVALLLSPQSFFYSSQSQSSNFQADFFFFFF